MYRIFCESFENFKKTLDNKNYRINISKPFELIVNKNKFDAEKRINSITYRNLCNLISYMQENIKKYPNFKAFLWTLKSRDIYGIKYNISSKEDLKEQAKLINSFLKLAYWY